MENPKRLSGELLRWYDREARRLPWRAARGDRPDPYRVWLSEIMLQQTTVAAVVPYFQKFTARWPRIGNIAAASLDDVLTAWAGLGYYARARNLHACAKQVATEHGGVFPDTEAELLKLPGIGPYTAAAIAAIVFDQPATVVDGNVERVMARLHAVTTTLPGAKAELRDLAQRLTPMKRPGDYAQAVMDLGATICTPRKPACTACPWREYCAAYARGIADQLPRREAKKFKPTRRARIYWLESGDGHVLTRTRPPRGLLGGMAEIPSAPWRDIRDIEPGEGANDFEAVMRLAGNWQAVPPVVRHTFTHFHLELEVMKASMPDRHDVIGLPDDGSQWRWVALAALGFRAFPSVMRKVIVRAGHGQAFKRERPSPREFSDAADRSA